VVGMESTGVCRKPVSYMLEDEFTCRLINAHHIYNVLARKSDVADAALIAQLVQHGLVRSSFVPDEPIRELRDLTGIARRRSRSVGALRIGCTRCPRTPGPSLLR